MVIGLLFTGQRPVLVPKVDGRRVAAAGETEAA
jgi:hypothetical protein